MNNMTMKIKTKNVNCEKLHNQINRIMIKTCKTTTKMKKTKMIKMMKMMMMMMMMMTISNVKKREN